MPFQGNDFVRTQNFTRDRDLGPPDNTISAPKVDDEFSGIAGGLTIVKTALGTLVSGADATRDTLRKLYDAVAPRTWFPALSAALAGATLRVNAAGTGFESRTPAQTRDDIGAAPRTWFPTPAAGIAGATLRVNAAGAAFESRTPAQTCDDIGAASKDTPIITTTLSIRQRDPRFGISLQRGDGTEIGGIFRDDAAGGGLSIYSNGVSSLFMNNVGMSINGKTVWSTGNLNPWSADRMGNIHSLGFTGASDSVPYVVRDSDRVTCRLYSEFNYPGWPSEIPEKFNALRLTGGGLVTGVAVPPGAVVTFVGKTGGGDAYDLGYKFLQGYSPSRGWISAVNEG